MTHAELLAYALQKPGAYLDHPFGPDSAIVKVRAPSQEKGRIFAQAFTLRGEAKTTLNCTPAMGELYRNIYPGAVVRGWHCPPVQQPHFNTINLDGSVADDEILRMIDHSYATVTAKLPKYSQAELHTIRTEENE